jgi:hypothetical protein
MNSGMQLRKVAFQTLLLGTSLYILLPTPDELVIYPVLSLFFFYVFQMPLVYGVLLSMIIYRGVGVGCLCGALLTGGKSIYYKLKERYQKRIIGGPYRI